MTPLEQLWGLLLRVRSLSFVARSANPTGWNGRGGGTVVVGQGGAGVLAFSESGVWQPVAGRESRFRNVFRWSAVESEGRLRLEHLRFGENHPVYLFDLAYVEGRQWQSASPHLCSEDCYAAQLQIHDDCIVLRWSISGPKKQEEIEYTYSWPDASR